MGINVLRKKITSRDGVCSWLTLLASTFIAACSCGFLNIFGICFNFLLEKFGSSKEKTAWIGSIPTSLMFILGPVACWCLNRYGLRGCTIAAAFPVSLSLLITSFAKDLDVVFIAFSIPFGLGSSVLLMASVKSVCIYFDKWLSLAYGLQTGSVALLQSGFSFLLVGLLNQMGFERAFQILSAVFFFICFISAFTFCQTKYESNEKDDAQNGKPKLKTYIKLLKNRRICVYLLANFVLSFAYGVSSIHQVQLAIERGVSVKVARQFPVFSSIATGIGRITCGLLLDLKIKNKIAFYQTAILLAGVTCFVGLLASNEAHLIAYIWIYSALDGMVQSSTTPCLRTISGLGVLGEAYSLVLTVDAISLLIGPPLVGLVVEKTKSYDAFFYMAGTPYVLAFLVLFLLRCFQENQNVQTDLDKELELNEPLNEHL